MSSAMRDLMLDLETWGTHSGCAIRSIGAVVFDPWSSELGDEFYCNVVLAEQLDLGLHVNQQTKDWWSKQEQQAQDALDADPISIGDALKRLSSFWRARALTRVWSQGANFDQPVIEEIYRKLEMTPPWKFYDSRCTRTAYHMAGLGKFDMPKFAGTPHYALDDAVHQARCVQLAHRKIKEK